MQTATRRLSSLLFTLLLALAPTFVSGAAAAQGGEEPAPAEQATEAPDDVQVVIDDLNAKHDAWSSAKSASDAARADAELATKTAEALTALDAALADARALRDLLEQSGDTPERLTALKAAIASNNPAGLADDFDLDTAKGLVEQWVSQGKDFVVKNGPKYAVNLLIFLVILLVFRVLARVAGSLTSKTLNASRLKVSELLKKFFVGIVQKLVFVVGLLIALGQVGVDTGPLLAGVGVVGFVVGFALQDTLGNFAAGIMILLYRPFDVGHVITAAGETGKVEDLTLVSTTLLTPDNQKLIVPNSKIWGGTIRNVTAQKTRRVDLTIGVGYGDDLDKTKRVLLDVVTKHELVLKDPAPQVEVLTLGESSVDFIVRPWTKTGDYWTVYFDLVRTIKQRFDQEGISIPFPQRDLHLVSVPEKLLQR
ncbi:MAG: mechanosensitive ion channel family protein [Planctomycetes bacterium]|nr:mechanosensitive ion channel family protein [Planctomycetota bacterium]